MDNRICKNCNKQFIPKNPNQHYCVDCRFGKDLCPVCGKEKKILNKTCGAGCAQKYPFIKGTKITPFKNKDTKQKIKQTMLERYSVDNIFKDTEYIKEATIRKCGVDNIRKDNKYMSDKFHAKYGYDHPAQCPEILQKQQETRKVTGSYKTMWVKTSETNQSKYGAKCVLQLPKNRYMTLNGGINNSQEHIKHLDQWMDKEMRNEICKDKTLREIKEYFGTCNIHQLNIDHKLAHGISNFELDVKEFIKTFYNGEIISGSFKIIPPKQLDLFIPELNIAFECNGWYWHNSVKSEFGGAGVPTGYHESKRIACRDKGIHLIQIWDYDWNLKRGLVEDKIKSVFKALTKPKYYARKCSIRELTKQETTDALNKYHIKQAPRNLPKYNYGLIDKGSNAVVAVICFKENKKGIELSRYAGEVVGGLEKLHKYVVDLFKWPKIFTLIDLDWSDEYSNQYTNLGYIKTRLTPSQGYIGNSGTDFKPRTAMGWHRDDWYYNPEAPCNKDNHYIQYKELCGNDMQGLLAIADGYYICNFSKAAVYEYISKE